MFFGFVFVGLVIKESYRLGFDMADFAEEWKDNNQNYSYQNDKW